MTVGYTTSRGMTMARLAFADCRYRNKMFVPRNLDISLAAIDEVHRDHVRLELEPSRSFHLAFWCESGGEPVTFDIQGTEVGVLRRG